MLIISHIILVLLWIAFGVLHSVLATSAVKQKMQRWLRAGGGYYQFGYSAFAAVSLASVLLFQFKMQSWLLFTLPVWVKWIVWLPLLAGVGIMAVVIRKYFFSLSGVNVFFKKRPPAALERGGLYHYVRHPLYAGTFLFIWSLFLMVPYLNNLLACIIITVYTITGVRLEEKKLVARFGEQYVNYKKQVPMIIPWKRGAIVSGQL
jgi:methanethiol S-methyltransferase